MSPNCERESSDDGWHATTEHHYHEETLGYRLSLSIVSSSDDTRCKWSAYLHPKSDVFVAPEVGTAESVVGAKVAAKAAGEMLVRLLKGDS
jgi:hypothetical protein